MRFLIMPHNESWVFEVLKSWWHREIDYDMEHLKYLLKYDYEV